MNGKRMFLISDSDAPYKKSNGELSQGQFLWVSEENFFPKFYRRK